MVTDNASLSERQLKLILALDSARDAADVDSNPNALFEAIARLLRTFFEADACAILLIDEDGSETAGLYATGMENGLAEALCREAMEQVEPAALAASDWPHILGVQIRLSIGQPVLGGFIIARRNTAFGDMDTDLLKSAESQIDSAIIQARNLWKLMGRNLELEAIFHIDRMRDNNPTESDLVNGFTGLVLDRLQTDLCMVLLSASQDEPLALRSIVDRVDLPAEALDSIRDKAARISGVEKMTPPPDVVGLSLIAAPFIVNDIRLGAVVVGRKRPFTPVDLRLLQAMTSQMDSALVHNQVMQQLMHRNRELEIIYSIDSIRDKETEFDPMLQKVLNELSKAVSSEIGYLMLYDERDEVELELKATTNDDLFRLPAFQETIQDVSRRALNAGELIYNNDMRGPVRSIIAIPLILNETIIGVCGTINSTNPRGFSEDDRRLLAAVTSQVDTAVFERLERRRMRQVLSRSVDPKVLEHLLQRADENVLAGERVIISMLFADLRGSTEWAERTDPEELVHVLNQFLSRMTDVIFKLGGTLDKFVGDEVIALFGCPVPMHDHALMAARAALEMQVVHRQLQAEMSAQGSQLPPVGIGVSSGEVIAGEIGPAVRTDFTAIGRAMNLGARLCSAAGPQEVLISERTYELIQDHADVEAMEPLTLKGIGTSVPVYKLKGLS